MKKTIVLVGFIHVTLLMKAQEKNGHDSTNAEPVSAVMHIVKEPRFMLNLHTAYAVGMGSTFKFHPNDVSRIGLQDE